MDTISEYFKESLNLLSDYAWIYDFQLTKFFTDEVWKKVPDDWMTALCILTNEELNEVPYGYIQDVWPQNLKHFLERSIALTLPRKPHGDIMPVTLEPHMKRGMSPKKQHEVCQLAGVVDRVCQENNCTGVVDVGSGLGYLSLVLSEQLEYRVLGIECEESRCLGADLRASKLFSGPLTRFQSIPLWLHNTEQSLDEFRRRIPQHFYKVPPENDKYTETSIRDNDTNILEKCKNAGDERITVTETESEKHIESQTPDDTPPSHCSARLSQPTVTIAESSSLQGKCSSQVCLIGLHCCGDLSPTMLRLFTEVEELKSLVILGCCYHRMTTKEDGGYHEFPLSTSLKKAMNDISDRHPTPCINQYALRLAAQETRVRWHTQTAEDHEYHQNNVAYRGILDLVLKHEGLQILKDKRKLASKSMCSSFENYVDAVLERISLDGEMDRGSLKEKLLEAYRQHGEVYKLIEPFTCLQVVLQGVLESLILRDRLYYLHEHGLDAQLVPVMDELISPRNMAIIATKKS